MFVRAGVHGERELSAHGEVGGWVHESGGGLGRLESLDELREDALGAALGEQRDVIEEVIEPYLMQQGLLQRTPRGRVLSTSAYRYLGLTPPRGAGQLDLMIEDDDDDAPEAGHA